MSTVTGAPATGRPARSTTAASKTRVSAPADPLSGLIPASTPAFQRGTRAATVWTSPLGSLNSISAVSSSGVSTAGSSPSTARPVPAGSRVSSCAGSATRRGAAAVSSGSPRRTVPSRTPPLAKTNSSKPSKAGSVRGAASERTVTGSSAAPPPAR